MSFLISQEKKNDFLKIYPPYQIDFFFKLAWQAFNILTNKYLKMFKDRVRNSKDKCFHKIPYRNMSPLKFSFKKGVRKCSGNIFYSHILCKVLFYSFVKYILGWLGFVLFCSVAGKALIEAITERRKPQVLISINNKL